MTGSSAGTAAEAAITASKAVVVMDHIKNNRIEYLVLAVLAHLVGWTTEATTYVQGMC
jgi:hypothetical protein